MYERRPALTECLFQIMSALFSSRSMRPLAASYILRSFRCSLTQAYIGQAAIIRCVSPTMRAG